MSEFSRIKSPYLVLCIVDLPTTVLRLFRCLVRCCLGKLQYDVGCIYISKLPVRRRAPPTSNLQPHIPP
jgi:hypothetical protein